MSPSPDAYSIVSGVHEINEIAGIAALTISKLKIEKMCVNRWGSRTLLSQNRILGSVWLSRLSKFFITVFCIVYCKGIRELATDNAYIRKNSVFFLFLI